MQALELGSCSAFFDGVFMQLNRVKSEALPVYVALPSTIKGDGVSIRALCDQWGFQVFGRINERLMWAALPKGWELDNMRLDYVWLSMRDEIGRLRMTMEHYSAAGKPVSVMTVIPRFEAYAKRTGEVVVHDNAMGATVYSLSAVKEGAENAVQRATEWLDRHFPGHKNAMNYWGDSCPADRIKTEKVFSHA